VVVVADENYGGGLEPRARRHGAAPPRLPAIVARSFARIAETNLKRQGILPLWFTNPADYDLVQETDRVSVLDLAGLAPGTTHVLVLAHADGSEHRVTVRHSISESQIDWFRRGSALERDARPFRQGVTGRFAMGMVRAALAAAPRFRRSRPSAATARSARSTASTASPSPPSRSSARRSAGRCSGRSSS